MMAPPGIPNTTSQPTASKERTSDWAPVSLTGAPAGGAGLGREPACGWDTPGGGVGRGVALVIGFALRSWSEILSRSGQQKTPVDQEGRTRVARRRTVSLR